MSDVAVLFIAAGLLGFLFGVLGGVFEDWWDSRD